MNFITETSARAKREAKERLGLPQDVTQLKRASLGLFEHKVVGADIVARELRDIEVYLVQIALVTTALVLYKAKAYYASLGHSPYAGIELQTRLDQTLDTIPLQGGEHVGVVYPIRIQQDIHPTHFAPIERCLFTLPEDKVR